MFAIALSKSKPHSCHVYLRNDSALEPERYGARVDAADDPGMNMAR
jgi:hypothetical protein